MDDQVLEAGLDREPSAAERRAAAAVGGKHMSGVFVVRDSANPHLYLAAWHPMTWLGWHSWTILFPSRERAQDAADETNGLVIEVPEPLPMLEKR